MSGWSTRLSIAPYEPPKGVVGVVVAQKFPDAGLIRAKLEEGIARVDPETVWVLREAPKANHAASVAWATLRSAGIEPFLAPLVPYWKRDGKIVHEVPIPAELDIEQAVLRCVEWSPHGYDHRRDWRDAELRSTCERIIVFHDANSNVTAEWAAARGGKIFVIERGKKGAAKRPRGNRVHA